MVKNRFSLPVYISIIVFSVIFIVLGILYDKSEGLLIGENTYASELQSSGGDSNFLVGIIKYIFIVNVIIASLNMILFFIKISLDFASYSFFISWIFSVILLILINLDVSLFNSIQYGNYLLFLIILFFAISLPVILTFKFFNTRRSR